MKLLYTLILLATIATADMVNGRNYVCTGLQTSTGKPLQMTMETVNRDALLLNSFFFVYSEKSKLWIGDINGYKTYFSMYPKQNTIKFHNLDVTNITCREAI